MFSHPLQWLFFAALGAWLTAGAVRPAGGAPSGGGAGRGPVLLTGAALLFSAVGASWAELVERGACACVEEESPAEPAGPIEAALPAPPAVGR